MSNTLLTLYVKPPSLGQSLELTLSDPLSLFVFEAQSQNSQNSLGIVWKIFSLEVPWVVNLSGGTARLKKVFLLLGPP